MEYQTGNYVKMSSTDLVLMAPMNKIVHKLVEEAERVCNINSHDLLLYGNFNGNQDFFF